LFSFFGKNTSTRSTKNPKMVMTISGAIRKRSISGIFIKNPPDYIHKIDGVKG
jgi:hypothetical protein